MSGIAEKLTKLLAGFPEIQLAILFGSQASGTVSFDSDIDLALLTNGPLGVKLKRELTGQIGARFGRSVDIIDLHQPAEPLLGEVLQGKRLLGSDDAFARLLTRHLIDTADFIPLQERILKERRDAWIH